MTPRLHGRCPACDSVWPLSADGTLSAHERVYAVSSLGRTLAEPCPGTGLAPVAGSAEAWLAGYAVGSERAVTNARRRLRGAEARYAEATAWIAKQRARLAKGRE